MSINSEQREASLETQHDDDNEDEMMNDNNVNCKKWKWCDVMARCCVDVAPFLFTHEVTFIMIMMMAMF